MSVYETKLPNVAIRQSKAKGLLNKLATAILSRFAFVKNLEDWNRALLQSLEKNKNELVEAQKEIEYFDFIKSKYDDINDELGDVQRELEEMVRQQEKHAAVLSIYFEMHAIADRMLASAMYKKDENINFAKLVMDWVEEFERDFERLTLNGLNDEESYGVYLQYMVNFVKYKMLKFKLPEVKARMVQNKSDDFATDWYWDMFEGVWTNEDFATVFMPDDIIPSIPDDGVIVEI